MAWSKEETIGRGDMRKIQLDRLRKTVGYIYGKNPVYKKKLDEAGVAPGDDRALAALIARARDEPAFADERVPGGHACARQARGLFVRHGSGAGRVVSIPKGFHPTSLRR
mgnify:CR=1 FL=1